MTTRNPAASVRARLLNKARAEGLDFQLLLTRYGLERLLPDPDSAAELLSYYYDFRDSLKRDGQWCYNRIHEEAFTWPYITKQMLEIVEKTLAAKPAEPEFKGFGTPAKIG